MSRSGREFRQSDKFQKSVRQQQERRLRTSERYDGVAPDAQGDRRQGGEYGNDGRRKRRVA